MFMLQMVTFKYSYVYNVIFTLGANDTQVFSAGATVNQGSMTPNLAQAVQVREMQLFIFLLQFAAGKFTFAIKILQKKILNFVLNTLMNSGLQAKPGVISSVGGLTLNKAGLQIQVLGAALSQMPAPPPSAPQTQARFKITLQKTIKMNWMMSCLW